MVSGALDGADPLAEALSVDERAQLAAIWQSRAAAEMSVAAHFALVTRELIETGSDEAVWRRAARAVGDEASHAELCARLAARYRNGAVEWPTRAPTEAPAHPGAPPELVPSLHVVALSCVSETIASVRLEAALAETRSPWARFVIRRILADEVEHARIGWAHLASRHVDAETRRALAPWLPRLCRASVETTLAENASLPPMPAHGLPPLDETRAAIASALDDVILPGFARVGFDTSGLSSAVRRLW